LAGNYRCSNPPVEKQSPGEKALSPGGLLHKQGPRRARLRGAPLPHSHDALVATPCSVHPPAGGPSGGPGVPPQHRAFFFLSVRLAPAVRLLLVRNALPGERCPGWCPPGNWPHRGRPRRIALSTQFCLLLVRGRAPPVPAARPSSSSAARWSSTTLVANSPPPGPLSNARVCQLVPSPSCSGILAW
jgi:hypothetical protein